MAAFQLTPTTMRDDSATVSRVAAAGEIFRELGGEAVARAVIGRGGDLLDFFRGVSANLNGNALQLDRAAGLKLTEADVREYSISRLCMALLQNRAAHERQLPDPFDKNQDATRQEILGERTVRCFETSVAGSRLPWAVLARDYNSSAAPLGTSHGPATDALRARLPLARLGASMVMLPPNSGSFKVPRINGDVANVDFLGEIEATTDGAPTTGLVDLAPKRVGGHVDVSRTALIQGGREIDRVLERAFFAKVRAAIENGTINGTATNDDPLGVRATPGVTSVPGGPNGAALSWAHITDLVHAPAVSNVEELAPGFLVNPGTRRYLSRTQRAAGLAFMWDGGATPLAGTPAAVSTLVPSTLTKGTSSGNCNSLIYCADWGNLLIVLYGAPELTVDPYTRAHQGMVRLIFDCYVGVGLLHPAAFATMDDALLA